MFLGGGCPRLQPSCPSAVYMRAASSRRITPQNLTRNKFPPRGSVRQLAPLSGSPPRAVNAPPHTRAEPRATDS